MKCPSCGKDNAPNVKFCKNCGSPMSGEVKRCENGHTYSSDEAFCPYCPPPDNVRTQFTVPAGSPVGTAFSDDDKTVIEIQTPQLAPTPEELDKTIIESSPEPVLFTPQVQPVAPNQGNRKLVGWLVTYDISPYGTDFRLYEGRTRIGRGPQNDIVLPHSGISDIHALLLFREGRFIIEDQLSTNGTFINDVSIFEKTILKDNDIVRIGSITLKLKVI